MKFESFRPKNTEELKNQLDKAQENLGEKLTPSNVSSLGKIDISNIQEKYKTRYDAYLNTLRAERRGDLDVKEIHHAKMWIKALNNLDSYIKDHESKDDPLLREKQFLVYKKIRDFLEQGKRAGYVKLPAGSGKTILFSKIVEALDMKTLIVSPSKVILNQNADETEEWTDSEYGKYYGAEKDLTKKVTHITYHSLVNIVRDGKLNPDDVSVLILDEAHRALGPERTFAVNNFNDLRLGFTATAKFSEDKKVSDLLEEEIYSMEVNEAIQEGMICQTQTMHAYTNVDLSSVPVSGGDYNKDQLEKVINVHGRNIAALELYKNKFSHLKAFVNCSGVKHAEDIAKLFNENGISAACITGDTPPGDEEGQRGWILNKYKEGEIRILTNARVLLEGFDESTCAVTFNLNPTLSLVDAEQRARSGRLDKNNPDKWSYVVDFIDQNSARPQVLYSEILKGDRVSADVNNTDKDTNTHINKEKTISDPKPPVNFDDISVDGLRVVVDTQMIMEITQRNLDSREENENIPEKKDGWETVTSLANKIKASDFRIKEFIESYRKQHPEWFEIQKNYNRKAEHFSPELASLFKAEFYKIPNQKDGWKIPVNLSKEINAAPDTLKSKAEKYRSEHPEWFEIQKSSNRIPSEHYSPELISILKKEVNEIQEKKEGWDHANKIANIFDVKLNKIKKYAEKYRYEHPEWFEMQKSSNNLLVEHYSPELVSKLVLELKNEIAKISERKDGWESLYSLSGVVKSKIDTIKKYTEKYRSEHPEWFEMQKSSNGKILEYFSPELISIINDKSFKSKSSEKIEGWENISYLAKLTHSKIPKIKSYIEEYRLEHPEWFKNMKLISGPAIEHYSPELISIIENKFISLLKKEGWENTNSLSEIFKKDQRFILKRVEKYRASHPEWFEIQRSKNKYSEHYSPELIDQIKKDL